MTFEVDFNAVLAANEYSLVDFHATWCAPCRVLSPILEKVHTEIPVLKVNTEERPDLAERFEINALPTLVFFKQGVEVKRHLGLVNEGQLRSMINEVKS